MNQGFRRSGMYFYRPVCADCSECRPIRINADEFRLSRSRRRVLRQNQDVNVRIGPPKFTKEKFKIYSDYLTTQHGCGPELSASNLKRFLYTSPVHTLELEYWLRRHLLAVGIVDICSRSLSSVYVFYDPDFCSRSLGTFSASILNRASHTTRPLVSSQIINPVICFFPSASNLGLQCSVAFRM